MSEEQVVNEAGQAPPQDSAPAQAPDGFEGAVPQPQPESLPASEAEPTPEVQTQQPEAVTPEQPQEQLVPLHHLFEARDKAREIEQKYSADRQKMEMMQAELSQWNQLGPQLEERLRLADQLEQKAQLYERQLQDARAAMEKEGLEWTPRNYEEELQKDRMLQQMVQTVSELRTQLPSLIDQGIQSRERAYQEAQQQTLLQQKQSEFVKNLDAALLQNTHIPVQHRERYRQMALNDAAKRGWDVSVDDYRSLLSPPPPPTPRPSVPQVPGQVARQPQDDSVLGEWAGKTWDDFESNPWEKAF
jgi:hypothetical protein